MLGTRFTVLTWALGNVFSAFLISYSRITAGYSWNHGCFLKVCRLTSSCKHTLTGKRFEISSRFRMGGNGRGGMYNCMLDMHWNRNVRSAS